MKEYSTIEELKNDFITGDFQLIEGVRIDGHEYTPKTCNTTPFVDMVSSNSKGVIVYESVDAGWLMFLWGADGNTIVPYDVRPTTMPLNEADLSKLEDRIIPDKAEVHFLNLPISGSVIGKVDTGAEMCSLHAEQVQINRGERRVSFICPQLSRSRLTVPLEDQQAIKTSGGNTTYRAVIKAAIKIKGKILKDIQINLNDRSEMDHPMLIGQNALQDGKFLVDPNIIKDAHELLSDDFLVELQKDEVVRPEAQISDETAQKLYEALTEVGDVEIGNLMKLLRTQVLKNIKDVTY